MHAETVVTHRLSQEAYQALEKQVRVPISVGPDTTAQQCGYQLGVQHVLSTVRSGFVHG